MHLILHFSWPYIWTFLLNLKSLFSCLELTTACHIQMVASCLASPRAQMVMGKSVLGNKHMDNTLQNHLPQLSHSSSSMCWVGGKALAMKFPPAKYRVLEQSNSTCCSCLEHWQFTNLYQNKDQKEVGEHHFPWESKTMCAYILPYKGLQ